MNVEQMLDRYFRLTQSRKPDRYEAIDLFNDALTQLSVSARIEDYYEIDWTAGMAKYGSAIYNLSQYGDISQARSFPIPQSFLAPITMVEGDPTHPNMVFPLVQINEFVWGYCILGDKVIFKPQQEPGEAIFFYFYRYPNQLVGERDVPEIDAQWHYLLPVYAASMSMMDVDSSLSGRLSEQWESGLQSFRTTMHRKHKSTKVNETMLW